MDAASDPARPAPRRLLEGSQRRRLEEMLRVDHAGELGAVHIYRGQRAVLGEAPGEAALSQQLEEMEGHEAVHLKAFDKILTDRRVRPTLLTPLWRVAGFALGAGTALMGPKAAHACTEAVETVIEAHYADQIREIEGQDPELAKELEAFRADELAHRDAARAGGAREAPGYGLLTAVIGFGCKAAIKISEKI